METEPMRRQAGDRIALHERHRVAGLDHREIGPEELWGVLEPILDRASHLACEEAGRSAQDRPIRLIRYGAGPTRVLIWSQMHGDEPTGTMALADLLHLLATGDGPAGGWAEELTLLLVPMLNPDGAARFQRENAQGIDLNLDARAADSPEMQTLLWLSERYRPGFGIELHDEDTSTRLSGMERIAALSLQAPPFDRALSDNEARLRAKRLCVAVRDAVESLVGGHVGRYRPAYSEATIGAQLHRRGTSTMLMETGWWPDDRDLQSLRRVNFVALVAALRAIAERSYPSVDLYGEIPENDRSVHDLLVRGGTLVVPELEPYRADLGVDFEVRLERKGGHLAAVGDLQDRAGIETIDASGLFVHPGADMLARKDGRAYLAIGAPATLTVRRGREPHAPVVRSVERGIARAPQRPPS